MSVKCKNCKNFKDDWCEKVADSPYPDLERDCNHFSQATNADRIRAMGDEELAEFLDGIHSCSRCRRMGNDCFPHWNVEKWLKKPAEEE